jgi:hypothetical protein
VYPGVRSDPFWDDRVRDLSPGDFSSPTPIRQTIQSQLTLSARRQTLISHRAPESQAAATAPDRRCRSRAGQDLASSAGPGWTLQLRNRWFADSLLEGGGFEPPVPVRGTTLFETAPFDFSAPSSIDPRSGSRPVRRSEPRAGSTSGRLSALRSTFIPLASGMLVDKEGRRSMLRCSRSASWGTLGSNARGSLF